MIKAEHGAPDIAFCQYFSASVFLHTIFLLCTPITEYTLYTTLPHNLIEEKLLDLKDRTFRRALKLGFDLFGLQ